MSLVAVVSQWIDLEYGGPVGTQYIMAQGHHDWVVATRDVAALYITPDHSVSQGDQVLVVTNHTATKIDTLIRQFLQKRKYRARGPVVIDSIPPGLIHKPAFRELVHMNRFHQLDVLLAFRSTQNIPPELRMQLQEIVVCFNPSDPMDREFAIREACFDKTARLCRLHEVSPQNFRVGPKSSEMLELCDCIFQSLFAAGCIKDVVTLVLSYCTSLPFIYHP